MPNYLIALSIGPVQGFIASARKTRDLWFGSYVLSEISKAAALAFYQQKAELIFPASEDEDTLTPNSKLNVANKVLVRVEAANIDIAKEILEVAKTAARERWKDLAQEAKEKINDKSINNDIWAKQVVDVLELFGAWVEVDDNYLKARQRVDELLAARKMTRDFQPAASCFSEAPMFGLAKSSLDAARETVLKKIDGNLRRRMDLGKNEQLDCPGVVKRLGGDNAKFPPVTRVALETWLNAIPDEDLKQINGHYEVLVRAGIATRVKAKIYEKLPFDGQLIFPDRIAAMCRELEMDKVVAGADVHEISKQQETLKGFSEERQNLYKNYGEPESYYAVMVADGDRMGKYLDSCTEIRIHQTVSRALEKFAGNVHEIIKNYQGACVYSGGDDVLALLPIHTAIACAEELQKSFSLVFKDLPKDDKEEYPTLSVGLGFAHVMTPFSVALDIGRAAEKLAKAKDQPQDKQGNALAIIVNVRSGARLKLRGKWGDGIVNDLCIWRCYFDDELLPSTVPYELQATIQQFAWAIGRDDYHVIISQEVGRILKKKRAEGGNRELSDQVIKNILDKIAVNGFEQVFTQLRIARWLTTKHQD